MNDESTDKPLRILAIVNLPWDPRLGAARVWIELAEEWRKAGHTVERFCLTDAFPKPTSSRGLSALRQAIFPYRAAAYVRRHGPRFDIIDCLIGTLPFSKSSLGFRGLLVARSVGLHRLYDRFHRLAGERWPDQPKGRFLGGLFYKLWARHLKKSAEEAIRCCDLLNLPNESELHELEENVRLQKPGIVQPYGLSDRHRQALRQAAAPAGSRLEQKRICFVGMWSLRKGARDWPEIIRRIWQDIPAAQITFLGTMFNEKEVFAELGLPQSDRLQCVPTYDPSELPALLAGCAVGLFPSYIEGFGLAVLEQLAAGIPTVAYDVPGPRQILKSISASLLAPVGEVGVLAARVVQILRSDFKSYASLRDQSLAIAAQYSWPEIAAETLRAYRQALRHNAGALVFTHPFGLRSPGGGARIMRALLEHAPIPFVSVCTSPQPPPLENLGREVHIPLRPDLGRIERTRLAWVPRSLTPLFTERFRRQLEKVCTEARACGIHSVAHGDLDFYWAFQFSKKKAIPFFLHVHDDFVYSARGHRRAKTAHHAVREAWQSATARFVIGPQLGDEYCRRYGERNYIVITDGLERVAPFPAPRARKTLRIYFMGLFHIGYEENLRVLLAALAQLRDLLAVDECSITLRCGGLRSRLRQGYEDLIHVLPFGSEADVQADMARADLLYLPLPFEEEYEPFVQYSLSTKMVTYLGSGLPILYHGPARASVYELLREYQAAFLCTSRDPGDLMKTLQPYVEHQTADTEVASGALRLARARFMLDKIRERFWDEINHSLGL